MIAEPITGGCPVIARQCSRICQLGISDPFSELSHSVKAEQLATERALSMGNTFERFYVNCKRPDAPIALAEQLAADGLATFDGVPNQNAALALAWSIGTVMPHRDSDPTGATVLAGTESAASMRPSYAGHSVHELTPHTDGSSRTRPPCLVMLACDTPAPNGGMSILVDGRELYNMLAYRPEALGALSAPKSVRFGMAPGYQGAVFEAAGPGRVSIRFRNDGLVAFSDQAAKTVPALLRLIDNHTIYLALEPGQGYVLQNGRWLHGRTAFTGQRRFYRILIDPYQAADLGHTIGFGFASATVTAAPAASDSLAAALHGDG